MADLNAFINKYNGRLVPSCGGYPNQCVSLSQAWASELGVAGCPIFPVGAAKDMLYSRQDAFDTIINTPTNVPQNGDILVWNNTVGAYGHTAVFIDGNASNFRSFDINWPTGSLAHIQNHNYNGVAGWLRRKAATPPPTGGNGMGVPNAQYDAVVVDNYNLNLRIRALESELKNAGGSSEQVIALNKQLTDRVNEMQKTLDAANKLIESLKNNTTTATQDKKIAELQAEIEALKNSTPSTLDSFSLGELLTAAFKKTFKIR